MLDFLKHQSLGGVLLLFLAANFAIFVASVISCWLLGVVFKRKRIFSRWEPLNAGEMLAALGAVVLNSVISVVGWMAWKAGYIDIQMKSYGGAILDCALMLITMDFGMYLFHRLAHIPLLYRWMHSFHHRHEATNPISLFVLHPAEVIGFGGLMILFLAAYPISLSGLLAYLTLNVAFGTLGHSGVEPFPRSLRNYPILRYIGTSTFHANHHEHPACNFGFYTLIWDKLFGTLDPKYDQRFEQISERDARSSGG
jgi:sterol desaturase/sphingolipid hydroxylase (fatty acid hydroxylase superfamily)